MARRSFTVEQVLTLLAETPVRIGDITAALTAERLQTRPGKEEWSANEVVAHLRACADVWGDSMRTILAEERPTIRAVNPRTWIKSTNYPELKFQASFEIFVKQRADLLAVLERLPRKSWSRKATLTGAGAPLEKTVLTYATRLAGHERTHVKQFGRLRRRCETLRVAAIETHA